MGKLDFALLGSAHGHIKKFVQVMLNQGGNFIGIYNDGSSLSKELSRNYSVPIYDNLEEIFKKGIDIAGTSIVNHKKIKIIEKCSDYGVHVIADKPIVVNNEQYNKLESIINEGKIEVGLMLTLRFNSCIKTVKKLVDNNKIGKLLSIEVLSPHKLRKDTRPDWHFDKNKNGGIVIDLMIHSVDLYNWFTESEIVDYKGLVQKSILKEKKNFYDNCQFYLQSKNGVSGYLRVDWHMTDSHWSWGDIRIFCTGSEGYLEARVTGDPLTREPQIILFEEGKETREVEIESEDDTVIYDFLSRVKGKKSLIGHREILEATKMTVDFDQEAEEVNLMK